MFTTLYKAFTFENYFQVLILIKNAVDVEDLYLYKSIDHKWIKDALLFFKK